MIITITIVLKKEQETIDHKWNGSNKKEINRKTEEFNLRTIDMLSKLKLKGFLNAGAFKSKHQAGFKIFWISKCVQ